MCDSALSDYHSSPRGHDAASSSFSIPRPPEPAPAHVRTGKRKYTRRRTKKAVALKRQRTDGGRFAPRGPVASESEDDQGDSVTEELDAADHSGVSCIMTTQSQVENDPTVDHEPNRTATTAHSHFPSPKPPRRRRRLVIAMQTLPSQTLYSLPMVRQIYFSWHEVCFWTGARSQRTWQDWISALCPRLLQPPFLIYLIPMSTPHCHLSSFLRSCP